MDAYAQRSQEWTRKDSCEIGQDAVNSAYSSDSDPPPKQSAYSRAFANGYLSTKKSKQTFFNPVTLDSSGEFSQGMQSMNRMERSFDASTDNINIFENTTVP
jgi:hypothetical protein